MQIDQVVLRRMRVQYRKPFTVSFGTLTHKEIVVCEVHANGVVGYGESGALVDPFYNEEYQLGCWDMMRRYLVPMLMKAEIERPEDVHQTFLRVRRNFMAKSTVEAAVWDAYAKMLGEPLWKVAGGTHRPVEAGVSIGIQSDLDTLIKVVDGYLKEGYGRIKLKIKPGKDYEWVKAVRDTFGDIVLQVDANSAYTLDDLPLFKKMDALGLLLIEQPLAHDDIVDHRHLQAALETPICLDESICTADDARKALELGSCRIVNIKLARVGGLTEAKAIHDVCMAHGVGVWCGGMLDAGVAKAHNIAAATLPNFIYPNDIPPTCKNFLEDYTTPEVVLKPGSVVDVPMGPGIGFDIKTETLEAWTSEKLVFDRDDLK